MHEAKSSKVQPWGDLGFWADLVRQLIGSIKSYRRRRSPNLHNLQYKSYATQRTGYRYPKEDTWEENTTPLDFPFCMGVFLSCFAHGLNIDEVRCAMFYCPSRLCSWSWFDAARTKRCYWDAIKEQSHPPGPGFVPNDDMGTVETGVLSAIGFVCRLVGWATPIQSTWYISTFRDFPMLLSVGSWSTTKSATVQPFQSWTQRMVSCPVSMKLVRPGFAAGV